MYAGVEERGCVIMDCGNLNINEARNEFDEFIELCTEKYMDKNNARFHIRHDSKGVFQMVIQ